jgi:hypothetical protein
MLRQTLGGLSTIACGYTPLAPSNTIAVPFPAFIYQCFIALALSFSLILAFTYQQLSALISLRGPLSRPAVGGAA